MATWSRPQARDAATACAPTASTCRPRWSCSVRNDVRYGSPPSAATSATTASAHGGGGCHDVAPRPSCGQEQGSEQRARRDLDPGRGGRAAADDSHGWRSPSTSATTTTGATTASSRPIADRARAARGTRSTTRRRPSCVRRVVPVPGPRRGVQQREHGDGVEQRDRPGTRRSRSPAVPTVPPAGADQHRQQRAGRVHPGAVDALPDALVQALPHPPAVQVEVPEGARGDEDDAEQHRQPCTRTKAHPDGDVGVQQAAQVGLRRRGPRGPGAGGSG